jgi:D-alanyl-D-alanine carboxypeptidase (penicillin-binding protein 5/6)
MENGRLKNVCRSRKKVSVSDLLKGIIIQSGNDASVALSEYVGGTERGFVDLMNAYAISLNMNNTIFQNSTGLPDDNHFSSAQDLQF